MAEIPRAGQSQMPFSRFERSSGERAESKRGPPGDAAVMCAATPVFTALFGSECGPEGAARQSGFEQILPTRFARTALSAVVKSSRSTRYEVRRPTFHLRSERRPSPWHGRPKKARRDTQAKCRAGANHLHGRVKSHAPAGPKWYS